MTEPVKKKKQGRWKAGESGNPNGRPIGAGKVAQIRAAIESHVPELLDALVKKAIDGDVGAARLLLERTIAPLRAVEPTQALTMPDGTLTDQGRAVLKSVAAGELAPSQGASLLSAIGSLARVSEIDELAARIEALEASNNKKTQT
jgi:Family of unknown function (DUF5681)